MKELERSDRLPSFVVLPLPQFHPSKVQNASLADFFNHQSASSNGMLETPGIIDEWDGILMFELASLDDLKSFFSHPEYVEHVRPDERKFIDITNSKIVVGRRPEWAIEA